MREDDARRCNVTRIGTQSSYVNVDCVDVVSWIE